MKWLVSILLIVAGVIHLLPLAGVLGAERLTQLYGVPIDEPNIELLMQHRAVLFGMLGAFLLYAAFRPAHQRLAVLAGLLSATAFLVLAVAIGGLNDRVQRVVVADVVAIVCLAIAGIVLIYVRRSARTTNPD